jgi:predicted DCC family thiol-disulfide oxidoreductase YuxK
MLKSRGLVDLENGSVVVFETDCILCNRWVQFVLAKERRPALVNAWSATG